MKAILLKAAGRVQRIGFRRFVLETAQGLGIAGYVRNDAEGSVSIFVQGEKERLEEFVKKVRHAPSPAIVKELKEFGAKAKPKLRHFGIRFGSVQEELQEGFGAVQTEFQDYRVEFKGYKAEFRDYRAEFSDFAKRTDENFKHLESRYGEISEKLTNIMNTLIEESKKTSEMLEVIKSDSRQTREMLSESMRLLKEAIDKMPGHG